jgi:tRNA-splicing ligase RtcB
MLHSGSRNIGNKFAREYITVAKAQNAKWKTYIPSNDLAILPRDTSEFDEYWKGMNWLLDFAKANRDVMADRIKECISEVIPNVRFEELLNIHHNYAAIENHFGKNVIVHRKGATSARDGQLGIIPGSQGTKSYKVRGLGNEDSFMSCSHGAGRVMSRSKAKEHLNLEDEIKKMDDLGIIHGMRNKSDLDEAASAYKDIDIVMENQKDLVEVVTELTPLAVIKG